MPRKLSLLGYPNEEYWGIVLKVLRDGKVEVGLPTMLAAGLRQNFYAWRRACEALPEEAARFGVDARRLREVMVVAQEGGLLFQGIGLDPVRTALREALAGDLPRIPETEADASMRRLQEMLKGGGDAE